MDGSETRRDVGMIWIAHRGESYLAPENTLAAIELAWRLGVLAVEMDVRLTRDARLVTCHDATTGRTAGVDHVIRGQMFDDLRRLDVGRWKGAQWAGERMPSLEQVLATVPSGRQLWIELKEGAEAVPALVRAIERAGSLAGNPVIISFHEQAIAAVKRALPHLQALWVTGRKRDERTGLWSPDAMQMIGNARTVGADGVSLAAKGPIDAALVQALHDAHLRAYCWTVDDPAHAQALITTGLDGITTNRAAWLAKQCHHGASS